MQALNDADLARALENLPHWEHDDGALITTFTFDDFLSAMEFVNALAALAEERAHHPGIIIEYDTVTIELTTHDADHKVTDADVAMAHAIEDMDFNYGVHPDYQ